MGFFEPGELDQLRRDAESRQNDTCRITKPGVGPGDFNDETGQYDKPDPITVYDGQCRIPKRANDGTATTAAAGEAAWKVGEYPLALPVEADGSADVAVDMTVEYLTSEADPALAGRVFGITGITRQTEATERRFRMKEVVGS